MVDDGQRRVEREVSFGIGGGAEVEVEVAAGQLPKRQFGDKLVRMALPAREHPFGLEVQLDRKRQSVHEAQPDRKEQFLLSV